MKLQATLVGVIAVTTLQVAQAGRPSLRDNDRDRHQARENRGGIGGFFRGVIGELREGHDALRANIHDITSNIRETFSDDDEFDPRRHGYRRPQPAPITQGPGFRVPQDGYDGPPRYRREERPHFGYRGEAIPASARRDRRTLPRRPARGRVIERAEVRELTPAPNPPAQRESRQSRPPQPRVERVEEPVERTPEPRERVRPEPQPQPEPEREPQPKPRENSASAGPEIVTPRDNPDSEPKVETEVAESDSQSEPIARDDAGRPLPDKPDYPTATATGDAGIVTSPYPPYDPLDVTGMTPGSLAKDPATGQIFRVP